MSAANSWIGVKLGAFLLALVSYLVPAFASDCVIVPETLLRGPHRTYTGRYKNYVSRYSVSIPKGVVGYDAVDPSLPVVSTWIFGVPGQSSTWAD